MGLSAYLAGVHRCKPPKGAPGENSNAGEAMYEKGGKFYADWRDRNGQRKRKSFTSPRAALRFESEQKELARPKSRARGKALPTYSAPAISKVSKPALRPQLVKR